MSRIVATLLGRTGSDLEQAIHEHGLDAVAPAVLLELQLISHVSAASLGQHVHQGKPGSKELSFGRDQPASILFLRRYLGCRTDTSRIAVLAEAVAEITATRYSRRPSIDCQTRDGRLQVGREAAIEGVKKTAYRYGFTERHTYRLRSEAAEHDARQENQAA
jgi:hypothetical protein